jgi:hypothetical protein
MLLWYAAGSVCAVWIVFQTGGLDFRMVAAGALAPLVLDAPLGRMAYAHALIAPVVALTVVMLVTAGRKRRTALLRRRLIGFPIGWFCGLVLAGAFTHTEVFWWPTAGAVGDVGLLPSMPWPLVWEAVGVLAARWCWRTFGLADPVRRRDFLRTGRLRLAVEVR